MSNFTKDYEAQLNLFPDKFIGWIITQIDICDDHINDFDDLLNVEHWITCKEILQEVRKQYQTLILDKR